MRSNRKFWLISAITIVLLIVVLSLSSLHSLQKINFLNLLEWDKLGHFLFYGSAMFCFAKHFHFNSPHSLKYTRITAILLFVLGLILEYMQYKWVPGRIMDWMDQTANTMGILTFLLISFKFVAKNSNSN
ncbi:MAG: VanZ family protein [Saprospiraceae bacterium]|nr:VanZ family protein [Saprospiraceae bacterium]